MVVKLKTGGKARKMKEGSPALSEVLQAITGGSEKDPGCRAGFYGQLLRDQLSQ